LGVRGFLVEDCAESVRRAGDIIGCDIGLEASNYAPSSNSDEIYTGSEYVPTYRDCGIRGGLYGPYCDYGVKAPIDGGGYLHFYQANYTEMLEASDFYDLNYMTNCYETSQDLIPISALKSVFPVEHVSFTDGFEFP